jgi:hypothetical protein
MTKPPIRRTREAEKKEQPFILRIFWRWLKGKIIVTDATDWIVAIATIVIAICAGAQYFDTHTLAEAALVANRAWVDPEQIVLASSLESESPLPLKYEIRIVNPGKKPALGVVWSVEPTGEPYIPQSAATLQMPSNTSCNNLHPSSSEGVVLYPAGGANYWVPRDIPSTSANQQLISAVLSRKESLVISGCFAYMTDGETHTSAFRYFLRDIPGKPSFAISKEGKAIPNWNFNVSLNGNTAN